MTPAEILTFLQILSVVVIGIAAIVLMRAQITELTSKIGELTLAIKALDASLDGHERRISQLEWERDHGKGRR